MHDRRHEPNRVAAGVVAWFALGLAITVALVIVVTRLSLGTAEPEKAATLPPIDVPPAPRLQVDAPADLAAMRAQEDQVLGSYGWVDRSEGKVRIPIDRAMDLIARRGLPVRRANP